MISSPPYSVTVIFGATACGKTDLAAHLFANRAALSSPVRAMLPMEAQSNDYDRGCSLAGKAEIISADSVQVYRDMPIGSAQPSSALLAALPHHLIGICSPDEEFSVADFVCKADALCKDIIGRGKLPVIVGGTAFYIKHFMYGLPVTPKADSAVRNRLQEQMRRDGAASMHAALAAFDPIAARKIHPNDEYRIIRAHEIYIASGRPMSSFDLSYQYRERFRFCPLFLNRPREELYRRIECRVDEMFSEGLVQEVQRLVAQGYTADSPAMKAIGYREFFALSPDDPANAPLQAVRELIKRNTKRYAKRQQTFFQSFPGTYSIDMTKPDCMEQAFAIVSTFYA